MTTLILSPVLALTLVSATQPVAGTQATTVSRVQARTFAVAKPDLQDAAAATPVALPVVPPPAPAAPKTVHVASKPVYVAPAANPNSVIGIIEAAAARWGVSGGWMVKIARCESGLRTNAYNPGGPYIGLFQFLMSTFTHNGGTNIYDAADQSNIAAKMLAHGQAHQWSCA
ncbi:MAG: transglycosylase family protein [Candidatus Dormibacteraeota bacterium]|nr:transglycosylase family protein [Candidatus Dormibacteraeota bacterium]